MAHICRQTECTEWRCTEQFQPNAVSCMYTLDFITTTRYRCAAVETHNEFWSGSTWQLQILCSTGSIHGYAFAEGIHGTVYGSHSCDPTCQKQHDMQEQASQVGTV